MKKWFRDHHEWALAGVALILLGFLVWFFVWGVGFLLVEAGKAVGLAAPPQTAVDFQLEEARQILGKRRLLE